MTKCSQCGDPGKDDPCNWCRENPRPDPSDMFKALEKIYAALDGAEDAKDACLEIAEVVAEALGRPSPIK